MPLGLSALAWLIPGTSTALRGFGVRAELTGGAVLILASWYTLVALIFVIGARIGRATTPLRTIAAVEDDPRFDRRIVLVLTAISLVGVLYALYLAQSGGSIVQTLSSGLGNQLSKSLDSQAGLTTLRYTPVVAAPIAVDIWLRHRGSGLLALVNVGLLLAESLFTSRLSLIIATVVFVFLLARRAPQARIRLGWILTGGALLFGALAALNFFRNSLYYRANGVSNPLLMNLYQIETYLGAPFQVSVGVADSMFSGRYWGFHGRVSGLHVLIPSFFTSASGASGAAVRYGGSVDVAPSLTTNSAFADSYAQYGLSGLLLSLLVVFGAAIVFGHALQYRSAVVAVAGVIGYTLADYWRILTLNQGIVVYLVVVTLGIAFVTAHTLPHPRRMPVPAQSLPGARRA